jgi:tetratricopeptide (TPR) repeat protein
MKARDISGYPAYLNYFLGMNSYEYANQASDPDFNEAEDYYLKAIEMDSTNPHFFFSIGYCYKKMGDIEKSTAAFNKVLSILPYQDYNKDYYGISGHSKTNLRKAGANK